MTLPTELVLGGHRAVWVTWTEADPTPRRVSGAGALPAGVLIDHGDHTMLVPWVPLPGGEVFTLDSLQPLRVVESVTCGTCGRTGWISGGAWLPAKAEVPRGC